MTINTPGAGTRWRCGHCGNLTRFDVVRTRTVSEYWHFSLEGIAEVTEVEVLSESLDRVSCRWCAATDRIELVPRPDLTATDEGAELGGP